jgi:hypothetical protein
MTLLYRVAEFDDDLARRGAPDAGRAPSIGTSGAMHEHLRAAPR